MSLFALNVSDQEVGDVIGGLMPSARGTGPASGVPVEEGNMGQQMQDEKRELTVGQARRACRVVPDTVPTIGGAIAGKERVNLYTGLEKETAPKGEVADQAHFHE